MKSYLLFQQDGRIFFQARKQLFIKQISGLFMLILVCDLRFFFLIYPGMLLSSGDGTACSSSRLLTSRLDRTQKTELVFQMIGSHENDDSRSPRVTRGYLVFVQSNLNSYQILTPRWQQLLRFKFNAEKRNETSNLIISP